MSLREKVRVSLDEFHALTDRPENADHRLELIDGEIVEKSMPKPMHGLVFHLIYILLHTFLAKNPIGQIFAEVQFEVPGEDYAPIPDIAFVSDTQPKFDLYKNIPFMPALAIEIQSPSQSDLEMVEKAHYYLKHGGQMVWLVYADRQLIEVLTRTERKLLTRDQTIDGGAVLPGFQAAVADMFPQIP
ncbi:MAG: Uma2 family endonuclease [Chloroflexota bacterium]|nr:Uma2 family endonuclease [Chloroflexota bacterium]